MKFLTMTFIICTAFYLNKPIYAATQKKSSWHYINRGTHKLLGAVALGLITYKIWGSALYDRFIDKPEVLDGDPAYYFSLGKLEWVQVPSYCSYGIFGFNDSNGGIWSSPFIQLAISIGAPYGTYQLSKLAIDDFRKAFNKPRGLSDAVQP